MLAKGQKPQPLSYSPHSGVMNREPSPFYARALSEIALNEIETTPLRCLPVIGMINLQSSPLRKKS